MSFGRVALVNALIFFLLAVHFVDIVRQSTHWPIGHYEMFSRLTDRWTPSRLEFVGQTRDGHEVMLTAPAYSAPLPSYHTRLALENAVRIHDPAKRNQALDRLCADCLRRYDAHRRKGDGAWPALASIQLYELRWNVMDRWARNAGRPDHKILLFEYHPALQYGALTAGALGEVGAIDKGGI